MKGTAVRPVNLKSTTGAGSTLFTLPAGGWVFGVVGSTDIMNFDHYYLPTGAKKMLNAVCKATLLNLVLSDVPEVVIPPVDPSVDPPAPIEDLNVHVNVSGSIITVAVNGVTFVREQ